MPVWPTIGSNQDMQGSGVHTKQNGKRWVPCAANYQQKTVSLGQLKHASARSSPR